MLPKPNVSRSGLMSFLGSKTGGSRPARRFFCAALAWFLLSPGLPHRHAELGAASSAVAVVLDANVRHQTIEGFGATSLTLAECGVDQMGSLRPAVTEAIYNKVKLTMGGISAGPYEGYFSPPQACSWDALQKSNDDSDPTTFNWQRFQWWRSDPEKTLLVDLAKPYGFNNFHLLGTVSSRWADQWLNDIRSSNYNLYLQEAAENSVAILVHWRDAYGIVPRWHQPFNEPLSGNNEVSGGSTQEIVDLVKAIGARLRREGFPNIKLVVPNEETEEQSLQTATAILNDPAARQYVGAIGFHPYPYGSSYADVGRILATSGAGQPESDRIQIRAQLRTLAQKYGLQVWMTEVSHGGGNTLDTMRARSIHIHDEMIYADASSYWGMDNNYTDGPDQEETIVVFDPSRKTFRITGMGYAIGHYARWVKKGAVRIDASSNDPLVQVTAFRDDAASRLAVVLINNSSQSKSIHATLNGLNLPANFSGEVSGPSGFWQPLPQLSLSTPKDLTITLPPQSVTSIGGSFAAPTSPVRVASAATSASSAVAPASIATLFADNLGCATETASAVPLPVILGNCSVTVRDGGGVERVAPLFYASPSQINFLIPSGASPGDGSVFVSLGGAVFAPTPVTIQAVSPGIFTADGTGRGGAAALFEGTDGGNSPTYRSATQCDPVTGKCLTVPYPLSRANGRVFLSLYGTGFRNRSSLSNVVATVGGLRVTVLFVGPQSSTDGLDQLNVEIPPSLASAGEVDVLVTVDGLTANTVRINLD